MNHVATICTHCGDGCKTTLGVRSTSDGAEIVRGDNRDKSGINGDFLCNKGRYAFDFANHEERITTPLIRQSDGTHKAVSWEYALEHVGKKFRELRDMRGGGSIGVIGGNRLTNEEAYLLQKFARTVLQTEQHRPSPDGGLCHVYTGARGAAGADRFAARHADRTGGSADWRRPFEPIAARRRGTCGRTCGTTARSFMWRTRLRSSCDGRRAGLCRLRHLAMERWPAIWAAMTRLRLRLLRMRSGWASSAMR